MSVKTETEWKCDLCEVTVVVTEKGNDDMPDGWIAIARRLSPCEETMLHVCINCVQAIIVEIEKARQRGNT